jgi:hypothetical protein
MMSNIQSSATFTKLNNYIDSTCTNEATMPIQFKQSQALSSSFNVQFQLLKVIKLCIKISSNYDFIQSNVQIRSSSINP